MKKRSAAAAKAAPRVSVFNETRIRLPRLSYEDLKVAALGAGYELSVIFVPSVKSRRLNREYRKKDKPTNVLSFPLSKTSGELYLCPTVVRTELPLFKRSFPDHLTALLIHGMLHLKGMTHGSTMERRERQLRKRFGIEQ
mgnify:CR=1 FL=1